MQVCERVMADFEVGDKIRASRTGTVTSVTTRWVGVDNGSEFPRNKSWDFEVVEKRKPKVGDEMTTALFASLPNGSLVQGHGGDHLYAAIDGRWANVQYGDTFSADSFHPGAYVIA